MVDEEAKELAAKLDAIMNREVTIKMLVGDLLGLSRIAEAGIQTIAASDDMDPDVIRKLVTSLMIVLGASWPMAEELKATIEKHKQQGNGRVVPIKRSHQGEKNR